MIYSDGIPRIVYEILAIEIYLQALLIYLWSNFLIPFQSLFIVVHGMT